MRRGDNSCAYCHYTGCTTPIVVPFLHIDYFGQKFVFFWKSWQWPHAGQGPSVKAVSKEKGGSWHTTKFKISNVNVLNISFFPDTLNIFYFLLVCSSIKRQQLPMPSSLTPSLFWQGTKFGEGAYFGKYARTSHQYSILVHMFLLKWGRH